MSSRPLKIDDLLFDSKSNQEIETLLREAGGRGVLIFDFPECYNHSDIAVYYLEVAFIGELLHSIDSGVSLKTAKSKISYGLSYQFAFKVTDYEQAVRAFTVLRGIWPDYDDGESYPNEAIDRFLDSLNSKKPAFPDLVDSYYANHIGSSYDWLDEYRDGTYSRHPEWAYHCWLSAKSTECGYPLYISPSFWMMPAGVDFRNAIRLASDIDDPDTSLELVENRFAFEGITCLLGSGKTAVINEWFYMQLLEIASIIFPVDYDPGNSMWSRLPSPRRFHISDSRDFLVCEGNTFTYILFRENFSFATQEELTVLRKYFERYHRGLSFQSGFLLEYKCDWSVLNDESFEVVCYDLIRRDGRFKPSKVTKMGLAKSRDGGRDIIAYTHSRHGTLPEKWLIQCKHSLSKKSLGRNAVQLAELIDEYAPVGVILATNLLVDAGMHDKAERVSQNRGIEIEIWDGLELERRVNQNPDIYQRYFEATS